MGLSIVIPAHNEEEALEAVVRSVLDGIQDAGLTQFEILVVNDGSMDETGKLAETFAAHHPQIKVLHHEVQQGLGKALQTGFRSATLEYMTWLPADGQFTITDALKLLGAIEDSDIIISDVKPIQRLQADSMGKLLLSKGLRLLSKIMAWRMVTYSGLLLFRRQVLQHLTLTSKTGIVNFELIHKAARTGYRIRRADFLVQVFPRQSGRSKVANLQTIASHMLEMVRLRMCRE